MTFDRYAERDAVGLLPVAGGAPGRGLGLNPEAERGRKHNFERKVTKKLRSEL